MIDGSFFTIGNRSDFEQLISETNNTMQYNAMSHNDKKKDYVDVSILQARQTRVRHFLLWITLIALVVSAVYNIVIEPEFSFIGWTEVVLSGFSAASLFLSYRMNMQRTASWIAALVIAYITLMVIVYTRGEYDSYVFGLLFGLAAYFLLGTRHGTVLFSLYGAAVVFLTLNGYTQSRISLFNIYLALIVGGGVIYFFERTKEDALQSLLRISRTDELTGLGNRTMFNEVMAHELAYSQRYQRPFALLLGDIDHLKRINDTYGHHVGDEVIRRIASLFSEQLRSVDFVARWGGEEFAIVLPNTTLDEAKVAADKLLSAVRDTVHPDAGRVTISLGVALHRQGEPEETLFNRADSALYSAKRQGRDRYAVEG